MGAYPEGSVVIEKATTTGGKRQSMVNRSSSRSVCHDVECDAWDSLQCHISRALNKQVSEGVRNKVSISTLEYRTSFLGEDDFGRQILSRLAGG